MMFKGYKQVLTEEIQIYNKHLRRYSALLVVGEMQIKTIWRHNFLFKTLAKKRGGGGWSDQIRTI